jgi:hydroxyethylthiazole kinase-like uncharacterized protein yjeF
MTHAHQLIDEPVLTVQEVVAWEKRIEASGTPLSVLMRRAGRSVADWIRETVDPLKPVVILCGMGNNGGDGWVVADYLASWDYSVVLITGCPPEKIKAEPAQTVAREIAEKNHKRLVIHVNPTEAEVADLVTSAALIVDAILGTGFSGSQIKPPFDQWIRTINASRVAHPNQIIVSVDVPSGLCADRGSAAEPTVHAHTTITMLAYKPGLLKEDSEKYCEEVVLARIE